MNKELLQIENVSHTFGSRRGLLRSASSTLALDDVCISISPGESLALVGESGSGKTTLGRVVAGLVRPTSGQVRLDGVPLAGRNRRDMLRYRRDVQMIFQNTQHAFNPRRTVRSILSDPYEIHGLPTPSGRDVALAELMEQVGLRPSMLDRYPHQFSGGQRQRIGIARALSLRPRLIVADEPVSALDVSVQAQVLNLFAQLRRELGLSLLFISHDLRAVYFLCERIAVIYRGRLVEVAPRERLLTQPRHPYTRCLISAVPSLSAKDKGLDELPFVAPADTEVNDSREPVTTGAVGCHYADRCDLYETLGRPEKCRTVRPSLVWAADSSAAACHFAPNPSFEDGGEHKPTAASVSKR
ncbi:oligopeptide/dipeptide ABC transporter ATP-binding protein [Dactylosporangium sp. CA-233914]|uniref:oligopeptide/dipeptide ABC transporter ATP-binding protein n=1 Tax=Dactylosporangium sp. CA-233914 TaxID=3239934 RepID=UPI003D9177D5